MLLGRVERSEITVRIKKLRDGDDAKHHIAQSKRVNP
jgi:hypothetical protein